MAHKATLNLDGRTLELPVIEGTEGELAIDISQLRARTGAITYDPGFGNTGSCRSAVTFIDGEKGILRYRGIPIEQFDTPAPDFLEVAMLLMLGSLPTKADRDRFRDICTENANLDENMRTHFAGFPEKAPPMAQLSAMINALSCFHPEYFRFKNAADFENAAARLISKIRTIAAYSYRRSKGLPLIYPNPGLRYCANFMHMMFSMPYKEYVVEPEIEDALNLMFILHADHEQNCSTSTVRMVGSSKANLFAACASGVCALWGPLHGGANQAVIEMLEEIHRGDMKPEKCIELAKDKDSGFRLMGFGHRVYKNYDPRAKILKKACDRVLKKLRADNPLLGIAMRLEELALKDPYFIEKKLYPNVDFYSGIIMKEIGIPVNMFPVMFAIGRLPGWIAQWKEQYEEAAARIARPRQVYVGEKKKDYVPMDRRSASAPMAAQTGKKAAEHRELGRWVDEMTALCVPDRVVWIDGSAEEKRRLEEEAVASGELTRLDQEKYPGCLYHRTKSNDVARTEHLTYICSGDREDAGPTNNWMPPEEGYRRASDILRGSMKGRTMYVIPFSMGPVDSPFSKIGVEITDSLYVVLNMLIMTRAGDGVLERLGADGPFTRCMHGKADLDENRRLILHFPEDNAVWSVGSGYGGNALLGKKCLSLRIASALARREGWLAEHMLILGMEHKDGRVEYAAASFPSACGKTNLAMLIPPEAMKEKGYRIRTVGDDIAWLRVGPDGRLWAVNPEAGFFGVAPGTNSRTNPNAMATIGKNTIYTNVVLSDDRSVWWEGGDGEPPASGLDWRGRPWKPGMKDAQDKPVAGAHPNSRFTAPAAQCPCISPKWEDPQGVPISAIIFGGRRARLAPLVYQSTGWEHGVYVGATMASERTAAQVGRQGEVRRDPMAMLPFCGYHMADYFAHWLEMGKRVPNPPRIFHVNWFRTDDQGKFLWPGYGENARVLEWILRRCRGEADAVSVPIGHIPAPGSLDLKGLDLPPGALEKLLEVRGEEWLAEAADQRAFLESLGPKLPAELLRQNDELRKRLSAAVAAR